MNPSDEFLHPPGDSALWSESYYFDFVDETIQGHVRLGFFPRRDVANAWVYLTTEDEVYWLHDEAISPSRTHGLSMWSEEWTLSLTPETVGGSWRFDLKGDLNRTPLGKPLRVSEANQTDVNLNLVMRGINDAFYYSQGRGFEEAFDEEIETDPSSDRYEQATRVEGRAHFDGESISFSGPGERDHSWGERNWFAMNWLWSSGGFEDGAAFQFSCLTDRPEGFNGFWYDGRRCYPIEESEVSSPPSFGVSLSREWALGETEFTLDLRLSWETGEAKVRLRPFVTTPIRWARTSGGTPRRVEEQGKTDLLFNRSACKAKRDNAVEGTGFIENGQQI